MVEHENVYKNESERYHALVSFEDYQHNLTQSIRETIPADQTILETGAGTGRVTKILFPISRNLVSFDLSVPMLTLANSVSLSDTPEFRGYAAADHRWLPVSNSKYDWVISGWSICYLVSWQRNQWKREVGNALNEFLRVLSPDGQILIIETLGTGKTSPKPPPHLEEYLNFLDTVGFQQKWIRTDYQFPDMQTARDLTGFFFGQDMLESIGTQSQPLLPECTGLWYGKSDIIRKYLPD
jgi:ubiquinone/menaquinone biosynthesis C-methylase UbiE